MHTVRIGFLLCKFYEISCFACNIGNAFYGATKEKVYTTSGPEFDEDYCGKFLSTISDYNG
jgi:hypothetical protein